MLLDTIILPGRGERAGARREGVRRLLLLGTVALSLVVGYLLVAGLLAVAMGTAEGARFSWSLIAVAALPGWLAAHQVPLTITGEPLTVLPWAPTLVLLASAALISARFARRCELTEPEQAGWVAASMGVGHALTGVLVALPMHGVVDAAVLDAFLCCGLVGAAGAGLGVAGRCGVVDLLRRHVDAEIFAGLRTGVRVLLMLLVAGAVVVAVAAGHAVGPLEAQLSGRPFGEVLGTTLLSVLYLPNVVVAGWSFAAGPGIGIGAFGLTPFGGGVPVLLDLPLWALLPKAASPWWPWVLLVPPLVGAVAGWWLRTAHVEAVRRLRAVGALCVVAGLGVVSASVMAGGQVGSGQFAPMTLHPLWTALATVGWVGVPALLVSWLAGPWQWPEFTWFRCAEAAEGDVVVADAATTDELPDTAEDDEADVAEADDDEADADGDDEAGDSDETDLAGEVSWPDADADHDADSSTTGVGDVEATSDEVDESLTSADREDDDSGRLDSAPDISGSSSGADASARNGRDHDRDDTADRD